MGVERNPLPVTHTKDTPTLNPMQAAVVSASGLDLCDQCERSSEVRVRVYIFNVDKNLCRRCFKSYFG